MSPAALFETCFVILASARSGSTALSSALNQHPAIYSDFEIFHPDGVKGHQHACESIEARDSDPAAFLERSKARALESKPSARIYGFKLFPSHNPKLQQDLIHDPRWKKILLTRENSLDQFISLTIAEMSGQWSAETTPAERRKITLDTRAYERFHIAIQAENGALRQQLNGCTEGWLALDYADIACGDFSPALSFLGADTAKKIAPRTAKQNSPATSEKITNADEVYRFLTSKGLEHFWVS